MKKPYIKPEIEIFEYKVEHGYAASVFVHDHDIDFNAPFTEKCAILVNVNGILDQT